jgi:hypothetical protein
MPEADLLSVLREYRRRFRLVSVARAVIAASAVAGIVVGLSAPLDVPVVMMRAGALGSFAASAMLLSWLAWRRWTAARVAREIEARAGTLDNLLVTAEEIACGRTRTPHPVVREALFADTLRRLGALSARSVQPLSRALVMAAFSVVAIAVLALMPPRVSGISVATDAPGTATAGSPLAPGDLRVIVTPPEYAGVDASVSLNPTTVRALEGSRIRLETPVDARTPGVAVSLRDVDGRATPFTIDGPTAVLDFSATQSRPLIVRRQLAAGEAADRLLHLRVARDERPLVAIRDPGKDLMFPDGKAQVRLEIEARDDVGLQSLALRYTRVSGAGETFTFEEGEWPIDIARDGVAAWRARATFSLSAMKLQDGDTLVYRAVARDGRPGADASSSDSYLIEIGRLAGVASTGFALPEERDRQAISQQMLIIKTERLHAERGKLSPEAFTEQSQLLAVEQRMVKAEFVFMTGGEVEDEVEEATHAHELAEGRLENAAQIELLAAIREMSRAEARLNAADTARALEFERAALKALQRAFDRRRYLLRTLPERTRIDTSRRLTGELDTARSSTVARGEPDADPLLRQARDVLRDLATTAVAGGHAAVLASRVLALDPESDALQQAALRLSSAATAEARVAASREAQDAIVSLLAARLSRQTLTPLSRDALSGRVVQEHRSPGRSP